MIVLWPFSATVDGLFMTLILLTLSGCFLLNAFWEMRDRGMFGKKPAAARVKTPAAEGELSDGNPQQRLCRDRWCPHPPA